MARTGFRRSLLAASAACGAMALAPAAASAQTSLLSGLTSGLTGASAQGGQGGAGTFNCDASALRLSLLGSTLLEPITAKRTGFVFVVSILSISAAHLTGVERWLYSHQSK